MMSDFRLTSYPGVLLRKLNGDDNEVLFRLFVDSHDPLQAAIAGLDETQRGSFLRIQFEAQQAQYRHHYPGARFDVIVVESEVIGNIYAAPGDCELRLVDINLQARFRNRGIGRALLQDLLDEAAASKKGVRLHVMRGNPAVRLYTRLGFNDLGEQGIHRCMEWRPS